MDSSDSPINNFVSYALAAAHRRISNSLSARLRKHGIQIEAWRLLETLGSGRHLTMGELAEIVLMNPPTLTKLVDRMVSDGLVHRQVSQSDHRKVNVLPTALGRKRMMQIRREIEDEDAAILSQLGQDDSAELIRILRGIA
ncbi:MarR family winged helix-turn-helix transcriptional regulator [Seohaeicola zhoushanensis]|uniref:Transcriptional regulator n=1 Tax=Seohaeicola zhoushanensis TaxID=1569283 RepID=A0A8J3H0M7_9RHOB|nr:MarR family winged helix-turn-helix transcriptional regulator [Seohaeicola zhoushanensis]GHF60369.1 transcriptional regulator [Seohaeicola zhoushanensis]